MPIGEEETRLRKEELKEIHIIGQALFAISDSLDKVAEAIQEKS